MYHMRKTIVQSCSQYKKKKQKPSPYPKDQQCSPCLHTQPPHSAGGCAHVSFFSASNFPLVWILWWFFLSSATLWDSTAPHWPHLWKGLQLCGNFSSFMTPSPGWVSVPKILCLPFHHYPLSYLISKRLVTFLGIWGPPPAIKSCFVKVAPHADDFLMYLWGRKWPSHPIPLPSWDRLSTVIFLKAHLTPYSTMSSSWLVTTPSRLSRSLRPILFNSSVYSCHLFLISSVSARSWQFLSFIMTILTWNVPLMSPVFLKRSRHSHSIYFICFFVLFI